MSTHVAFSKIPVEVTHTCDESLPADKHTKTARFGTYTMLWKDEHSILHTESGKYELRWCPPMQGEPESGYWMHFRYPN